jgi:outer membrane protein W
VDVQRHNSSTWAQLEAGVYEEAFGSIMQWGADYMVQPCEVQIFYNSDIERIDVSFKLKNEPTTVSERLDITFEPGYPVGNTELEDLWDFVS